MRLRQTPLDGSISFVDFLHEQRIHLVLAHKQLASFLLVLSLGIDQFFEIRLFLAENFGHFIGPLLFVVHVGVIQVLAEFVLKEPRQLAINQGFIGVPAQAIIAQQFQAAADPAPAIGIILELD